MDLATGNMTTWATPDRCVAVAYHASRTETTGSLPAWPEPPTPTIELTATANDDGTETVTARDSVPQGTGGRFIRLRVTQP